MKEKALIFLVTLPFLLLPLVSLAQQGGPAPTSPQGGPAPTSYEPYRITIPNPLRSDINSIPKLVEVVITELLRPIAAVVVVLMLMYAGFLFVTAQGNQAQITKARDSLLYGSIGAGILLGAEILAYAIQNTVNQLK